MHVGTHPTFKLWKGSVDTRSAEAKPLQKIDKLVSIWVSFKPDFWNLVVAHDMERDKDD
jgi:hypothetical protein